MTFSAGWHRFFPLFLKHDLLPEPVAVQRLREEGGSELAELAAQSSRSSRTRNVAKWEALKQQREEAWRARIEAARVDIANYDGWAPASDDWMRLAIGLAISHGEPGFGFEIAGADKTAEQNWHRHSLMVGIMAEDKDDAGEAAKEAGGGEDVIKQARDAVTAEKAAGKANEFINQLQVAGRGSEYGQRNSEGSLKVAFAARNKAWRDGRQVDQKYRAIPPSCVVSYLRFQTHFESLIQEAKALERPSVD